MIDHDAIRGCSLRSEPFTWGILRGVLPAPTRQRLGAEFPERRFKHLRRRRGSDKTYEAWFRSVQETWQDEPDTEGLSEAWKALVVELCAPAYRAAVGEATGLDLSDHRIEISMWRYRPSCYLSPHTDIAAKRVTHLMYFNDTWEPAWGGQLRILNSADVDDVAHEVDPNTTDSVLMVRADNSWHAVARVHGDSEHTRTVLQVSFWSEEPVQGPDIPGLEVLEVS